MVTINDIAKAVGVNPCTVSRALNDKPNPIKVSDKTRHKIFQAAKDLGYHPSAAARALATRRTGHLGFLVSDSITGGWLNQFVARYLVGIERGSRKRGYGLNISLYNMDNFETFVFPASVGQRSIDGLILTGYVEAKVVAKFRDFGIPTISLGQDLEVARIVPTIASDDVEGKLKAIRYLRQLGHCRILLQVNPKRRGREVGKLLVEQTLSCKETNDCQIELWEPSTGVCDFNAGPPLLAHWLSAPVHERPTALIATDQTLVAFLPAMAEAGYQCPRDVSLISSCETLLCETSWPPLTALNHELEMMGELAVNLLVDHLDEGKTLTSEQSCNEYPCRLIERGSCGSPGI